tara:strand:- start:81 stop:680 length:600 start_codon:yes stop_codon:yes gene_type:complete
MKKWIITFTFFIFSCGPVETTQNNIKPNTRTEEASTSILKTEVTSYYSVPKNISDRLNLNLKRCKELDNTVIEIVDDFENLFYENFSIYDKWEEESIKSSQDTQLISDLRDAYIKNAFELRTLINVINITLELEPSCFDELLILDFEEVKITRTLQGNKRRWANQLSYILETITFMNKNTKLPGVYGSDDLPTLEYQDQ